MNINPRDLVSSSIELATLPDIFIRVNEMINNPIYSASDIGRVISNDPGLTARLLKMVNSVFYNFPSQVDTVSRAITIIGTKELRDLILATSVVKMFKGLTNEIVSMENFWKHSIFTALTARALAARRHDLHTERYFIAGLLHDIGSLVIYRKLPELAREALLSAQHGCQVLHLAEREIIGFDHATVGGELMRKWKLPVSLQQVVEFHHEPSKALEHHQREAALIHIADLTAEALCTGTSGNIHVSPLDHKAWELAGLTQADIAPAAGEAQRQIDTVLKLIYFDTMTRNAVAH